MTDRELLELAAKAAGYSLRWHDAWKCFVHVGPHNITNPPTLAGRRNVWVPFDDDGDALRLAVKLGLFMRQAVKEIPRAEYEKDPYAATRRAIVRAAAAAAAVGASQMTSPIYNICTRCGRKGHCAASCKEPINA